MTPRPGYATLNPYLVCADASAAMDWYATHLGAGERCRLPMPDGRIAYAELDIGGSVLMISDAFPDIGIVSPDALGGSPVSLTVYVDDADAVFAAMLADGAQSLNEIADQFHGDRAGKLRDPFGHIWFISTNVKPLEPAEIVDGFKAMMGG